MKKTFARFLSLLLVVAMLMPSALAVPGGTMVPGAGVVGDKDVGGLKETPFGLQYKVGIALGIQQMQGDQYTVKPKTTDEMEKISKGLANTADHFLYSYPNPYAASGSLSVFYILPSAFKAPKYATTTGGGVGQYPIDSSHWMYGTGGSLNMRVADALYKKAVENVTEVRPAPALTSEDIAAIANGISTQEARDLINYIYWHQVSVEQMDVTAINNAFEIAYLYGVDAVGDNETLRTTRYICNYAAIVLSLAKLLPSTNWSTYLKYVQGFVTNALNGDGFQPVVITAELVMPFEYNGDNNFVNLRTTGEAVSILTGAQESKIRTADISYPDIKTVANNHSGNQLEALMKRANQESGTRNGGALGGYLMFNRNGNGTGSGIGKCAHMLSVSSGMIESIKTDWGLGKVGSGEGMWGFGVWGIDDTLAPIDIPPATSAAGVHGSGTISIAAEPKLQVKEVGGYSTNFDVTVTVNLKAGYTEELDDKANEVYFKNQSADLADTFKWLARMRDGGFNFPNPKITIWVSQSAEGIPALDTDVADNLIEKTRGYYNNGEIADYNYDGEKVSPRELEAATGANFNWQQINIAAHTSFKDTGLQGISVKTTSSNAIEIEITDLWEAYDYFLRSGGVLTFKMSLPGNGTLEDEKDIKQHWWIVGGGVVMYGPGSLLDMNSVSQNKAGLRSDPKYDYVRITAEPEDQPYYYSTYQEPYAEFKQGTVPTSGGGSDEEFNSMTGTPTFTDTSTRIDFEGTPYENAGRYYQYFASGGSEFVVQFDGKYHYNESATRTFTFNFSGVNCDQSTGSYKCPGHPQKDGPPSYCDDSCVHAVHCKNHPHVLSSSCSFSVTYNGLSYVEITNLKVWKLSEARVDGTRELLDTKEVYAEVKSTAPGISYNIAASNTAEQGRMVYEWMPKGTGEGGDRDNLVWNRTSSSSCSGAAEENKAVVEGILSSATAGAVMLSDYIVLHTTNGDQSILYFETESDSTGVPLMSAISTSSHSPTFGSDNATITVTVTPSVADGVEFPELKDKDTETLQNLLWKNNPYTSEGCALPEDGITYGGYNGNYSSMNTKYKSSGHPANMTSWSSTAAYKNISGVFGQKSNSELYKATVTKKFRLLNDELVIPDYKQNGEYILGNSEIFYENIVDFSNTQANFPIIRQSNYDGKEGFVLATTYSPSHDKINDIVVYNPVSNQNAIVVSLPKDRDQRVATHITTEVDKNTGCPGDATCPYLKNVCTVTDHIHTESCYKQLQYEVHGPNNVHVHDENCGGGSDTIKKSVSYSASGTDVYSFTATGSGTVRFYSTSYNKDPRGRIYVNGSLVVNNDDGGSNLNFDTGEVHISKGDSVRLNVCQYGSTGSGTCSIVIEIEYDGGGWYVTHGSGCSYAGETHFTTSKSTCTTCGHSCGGTYTSAYTCNNLPLNAHQCNAGSSSTQGTYGTWTSVSHYSQHSVTGYKTTLEGYEVVVGTDGYTYMFGTECGRTSTIKQYGSSFPLAGKYAYTEDRNGSSGHQDIQWKFKSPLNTVSNSVKCYTMYRSILSCSDPHHAYSYNWRIYTYGLKHTSGKVCSGRGCTDTTNLIFPTQEEYSLAECAAGYIVRHSNGDVHLSTEQGVCTYCGQTYKELLSSAQDTDRTPDHSEYECYPYGDTRCWQPCGDNSKHQKVVTEVTDNGTTYQMGDFINLDWPFTIYFPNTGDFYGTGAKWSSSTSAERGHGYTDGMDTTEWIKTKWVQFPFAVVYNDQTYLAHEKIYLSVPETIFEFYVPLHDDEMASAEVKFGTVAINAQNGEELECGPNKSQNIENITYNGKPKAHHHNADKRTYIDVVGRIGNLALNDTGDFRYSNLFKQPLSEWLVQNIVKKVDPTKQNYIMLDGVDVRKVPITSTGVAGNTHNTRPERGNVNKVLNFPLTPAKNNITALQRQPIRVGYDSYFDLTTLGNYYGNTLYDTEGAVVGSNLVLIKPHYYRLDLDTGNYEPVDVYMDVNGNYVLINDNDSNTVAYSGTDANVNLNWVEEKDRRNYSGSEVTNSNLVADANSWIELPRGSSWVYGNYNILNLTQRNRTFVGSEYTYNDKDDWNSHKDPSDRLPNTLAALQGQRWHFNVGLPSSAVFVYSGQEASEANIKACTSGNAVIFCALEIYSQGEVWTLAYDGSNVNVPFKVTPDGKTYDPYVPYPDPDKNPKGEEMPIVSIISINHSSKEDMDVIGTQ